MKSKTFSIQTSAISWVRQLICDPEAISIDGRDSFDPRMTFPVSEIDAYRFGVNWIRGWRFVIGRVYFIEIRNVRKEIIRIRLLSVYGIKKQKLGDKYIGILSALNDMYFNDIAAHYIGLLKQGLSFELCGAMVSPEGLWLKSVKCQVPWKRLKLFRYVQHFAVTDKEVPDNPGIFYYRYDWNAMVLFAVAESRIKAAGG